MLHYKWLRVSSEVRLYAGAVRRLEAYIIHVGIATCRVSYTYCFNGCTRTPHPKGRQPIIHKRHEILPGQRNKQTWTVHKTSITSMLKTEIVHPGNPTRYRLRRNAFPFPLPHHPPQLVNRTFFSVFPLFRGRFPFTIAPVGPVVVGSKGPELLLASFSFFGSVDSLPRSSRTFRSRRLTITYLTPPAAASITPSKFMRVIGLLILQMLKPITAIWVQRRGKKQNNEA